MTKSKATIGWREWISLPDFNIPHLKVKVDTGARTSALHAFVVEPYTATDGREWIRFGIHPEQKSRTREVFCTSPVKDKRVVRDSGGHEEERFVIDANICLGDYAWTIEMTLTARDDMLFRMLLGRTACKGRFVVDPARSFCIGKRPGGA